MCKLSCAGAIFLVAALSVPLLSQDSSQPAYVAAATRKFANFPGLPQCSTGAVDQGDPSNGNAVLLLKVQSGCAIPWHWHTPSERLMMVSGRGKAQMKDESPVVLRAGDFMNMEGKRVHQFTCTTSCMLFLVTGDAPFDIHYVDASGIEIPSEQALKSKAKAHGTEKKSD